MDLFRHKLEAGRRGDRLPWLAAAVASLLSCRAIAAVEVAPPIIPAPEPGAEWSDRLRSAAGMPRGHLAANFRRSMLLARVSCRKGGGAPPLAIHPDPCGREALPQHMGTPCCAPSASPHPGVAFARSLVGIVDTVFLGITLSDEAHPDQPGGRLELSVRPQFEGAHAGAPRGLTHVGDVNSLRHVKPAPWRAPSGDQPDGASFADHTIQGMF